jgi:hypothetical protein
MPPFLFGALDGGSRHKFLKAEDDLLINLVEKFGEKNWTTVAQYMKRRSARQCRERYKNYLSPSVNNRAWSEAEDELLTNKVAEIGPKWSHIAAFFEARSDVNVKNRWSALLQRNARLQRCHVNDHQHQSDQLPPVDLFSTANQPDDEWDWTESGL